MSEVQIGPKDNTCCKNSSCPLWVWQSWLDGVWAQGSEACVQEPWRLPEHQGGGDVRIREHESDSAVQPLPKHLSVPLSF